MKPTRPGFTVRRMMVAVAVVAMTIAAIDSAAKVSNLARAYRAQAEFLSGSERHDLEMATTYDRRSAAARAAGDERGAYALAVEAKQARKYAAQYGEWTRSYQVAATRPWRSLPPGTIKLMVQPPPSPMDVVPYTLRYGFL